MSKSILYGAAGLLIGAVIGFLAANYVNRNAELGAAAAQPQPGPAQQTVVAETSVDGTQADVAEALNLADAEPQNFVAQMKAGDMYARIGRFEKAIEYYTLGAAYSQFMEERKGMLREGYLADITILSENIFNIPEEMIMSVKADYTVVDGKIVFERKK